MAQSAMWTSFRMQAFLVLGLAAFSHVWVWAQRQSASAPVARWDLFEAAFTSARTSENPFQDVEFKATFTAPSGQARVVRGFWDGGATWRVRFSPDEVGEWRYATAAVPDSDSGLHGKSGTFRVTAPRGKTRFDRHGPLRLARTRTHLEHADGTPFFWLADTGWNAAMLSTPDEWQHYVTTRSRQRFTAVQWVATQWRAAPEGDRVKERAFTGHERIAVNPTFFQRLDEKAAALNRAGLLNVPVLLWAISGGATPAVNPGHSLPEDQAIRLAQYMVARWQGHDVVWLLPGDGDYRGDRADKWKRIGRAVFGDSPHAPVSLHPGGMHWVLREFQHESWLDIHGYQSGHGDDDKTLRWMTDGPPATDWKTEPVRPFINLEPPYENHIAYQSRTRISPHTVRRAVYWSLLGAPTAGVTYGAHGVWGWDDGTKVPTDHANSGIPLHWRQALTMPGAEQMAHVAALFTSLDFWRLRPDPAVLAEQPGTAAAGRFIAAAATESRDIVVIYTPASQTIAVSADAARGRASDLRSSARSASWLNPRDGSRRRAPAKRDETSLRYEPPGPEDWILILKK
jgi:hypothetical protein